MLGRFISPLYGGISTDIVLMTKLSRCFLRFFIQFAASGTLPYTLLPSSSFTRCGQMKAMSNKSLPMS